MQYRRFAILGTVLMAAQAFCYNAIFFTYALILTKFYAIPTAEIGWFIPPFAVGAISRVRCCSAASSTRSAAR